MLNSPEILSTAQKQTQTLDAVVLEPLFPQVNIPHDWIPVETTPLRHARDGLNGLSANKNELPPDSGTAAAKFNHNPQGLHKFPYQPHPPRPEFSQFDHPSAWAPHQGWNKD
jgi:hypothetical protein